MNEKYLKSAHDREEIVKSNEDYKKLSFTQQEVLRQERDRRLMEMSKYKEDLDRTSPTHG